MKNIYYKELTLDMKDIILEGDGHHHFKNVLRGKVCDEVKVFNGLGLIALGVVENIGKREMAIALKSIEEKNITSGINLIIGIPKKEYLESIIRSAIQTGVSQISLVTTEYTPWKYKYYDRLEKIMESALIQSENPYLPVLKNYNELSEALDTCEGPILALSTEIESQEARSLDRVRSLLIGPEGGFSNDELEQLSVHSKVKLLRCKIPIMKAEVAVPFGLGFIYGKKN